MSLVVVCPIIVGFIYFEILASDFLLACNYKFTLSSGTIESLHHPSNYPNSVSNCKYSLKYPSAEYRFVITFSHFSLESHSSCSHDSLKIYDGETTSSTMLGNSYGYCGTSMPPSFTSTSNEMLLTFKTDGSGVSTGFKISYSIQGKQNFTCLVTPTLSLAVTLSLNGFEARRGLLPFFPFVRSHKQVKH